MSDFWVQLWDHRQLFLTGLGNTVVLTIAAIVASTVLGFLVAVVRRTRIPVITQILGIYLEVFRGTPLLVQILFVYFGAAYLKIPGLSEFNAILIALTLYQAAYITELFRGGFESVSPGQLEAGRALGMSKPRVFVWVVLPQAMRVVIAPLFGQYIGLVKQTALASVIGYADLMRQAQGFIDRFGSPFIVFALVAVVYFFLSYPLSVAARKLEEKAAFSR